MRDSFRLVDNVLAQAVGGISNVILSHGANDINLDFADVKTVMSHRGLALMGVGESQGNSAAYDAAKTAIESPLLDNLSIDGAMGILVHFHIHPDYPLAEISEAMDIVEENADEEANIIFGTTTSEDIPLDSVKLTIIATGFEDPSDIVAEAPAQESTPTVNTTELRRPVQGTLRHPVNSAKVVGGYNNSDDYLDTPTFLRKQMD